MKWVIVVSHYDKSGIIGVYGPYDSQSIAESNSEWLQSLPGSKYTGGLWEVMEMHSVSRIPGNVQQG